MQARVRTLRKDEAAFTLIELLAVIIILGILASVLLINLRGATEGAERDRARVIASQIGLAITELVDDKGDCPRSTLPTELGLPPNTENLGAECLYLALCADKAPGSGKFDEHLGNTDADELPKNPPGFNSPSLFELCDPWGNPYAYFHHKDYDRADTYATLDPNTGEPITSVARAVKNTETNKYWEPRGYQLISAGPDGNFETTDDNVTNFKQKPKN